MTLNPRGGRFAKFSQPNFSFFIMMKFYRVTETVLFAFGCSILFGLRRQIFQEIFGIECMCHPSVISHHSYHLEINLFQRSVLFDLIL